jgi:hypothetical protein
LPGLFVCCYQIVVVVSTRRGSSSPLKLPSLGENGPIETTHRGAIVLAFQNDRSSVSCLQTLVFCLAMPSPGGLDIDVRRSRFSTCHIEQGVLELQGKSIR